MRAAKVTKLLAEKAAEETAKAAQAATSKGVPINMKIHGRNAGEKEWAMVTPVAAKREGKSAKHSRLDAHQ